MLVILTQPDESLQLFKHKSNLLLVNNLPTCNLGQIAHCTEKYLDLACQIFFCSGHPCSSLSDIK